MKGDPPSGNEAPPTEKGASKGATSRSNTEANAEPEVPPFSFSVLFAFGRRYLSGYKGLIGCYIVAHLVTQTILPQQVALFMGRMTNHFSGGGSTKGLVENEPALLTSYGFWISFTLVLILLTFLFSWLTARMDGQVTNSVKRDLFGKILRKRPEFYHSNDSDRLTMIVNQYSNQIAGTLRALIVEPILQIVAIVLIGFTIYHSLVQIADGPDVFEIAGLNGVWVLFGGTLLFALTSPWIVNRMGKYLQRDSSAVQNQLLGLATLIGGALKAPEEIQAMRAEPIFEGKLETQLEKSLRLQIAQRKTVEKINAFSRLPGTIVLAAFLGLAIYMEARGGDGQPGTIVQVALLTPLLMGAIQQLSSYGITLRMGWPPMHMIHELLGEGGLLTNDAKAKLEKENLPATLEAKDITFSYRPSERPNVFEQTSFHIPEGKVTGFVARPGQGKTTFFRLALRFYDVQDGQILLGGQPLDELSLDTVRSNIVLMSQFPAFFYDTVRENMLVANPDATDDEILRLAEITGLGEVMRRSIGENALDADFAGGAGLSGGQKKLFALTRCLLRDPAILFLDEPTTGMGPMEKFPLIDSMRNSLDGRTVVVVDHDIVWQSRFCDYFHVLNDGKIIQSGTPDELLAQDGLFRDLYEEASGQSDDDIAAVEVTAPPAMGRMDGPKGGGGMVAHGAPKK